MKDDKFQQKHIQSFNSNMEETHLSQRTSWPSHWTEAEKSLRQGGKVSTQITIMNGITAYRLGGWEAEESTPWKVKYIDDGNRMVLRSRVLTYGWVTYGWVYSR